VRRLRPKKWCGVKKQIGDMALAFGKRAGERRFSNGCVRNVPAKGATGRELAEVPSLGRIRDLSLMVWTAPAGITASRGHDVTFDDQQTTARSVHDEGYNGGN
jgi:hypothetical protein